MLENKSTLKVGIDPWRDVEKLLDKYDLDISGTLDLRFLAEACKEIPNGLAYLARVHLGMNLNKNNPSIHSEWERNVLSAACQKYAAEDAFASIELFKHFAKCFKPANLRAPINCFDVLCRDRTDKRFVYRSELYARAYPQGGNVEYQSLTAGFGSTLQRQKQSMSLRTQDDEQQSEGVSGMGIAVAAAAGLAALGGFLYYKSQRPK